MFCFCFLSSIWSGSFEPLAGHHQKIVEAHPSHPINPSCKNCMHAMGKGGAHPLIIAQSGANQTAGFPPPLDPLEPIQFWLRLGDIRYMIYWLVFLIWNGNLHKFDCKVQEWKKLSGPSNQKSKKSSLWQKKCFRERMPFFWITPKKEGCSRVKVLWKCQRFARWFCLHCVETCECMCKLQDFVQLFQ